VPSRSNEKEQREEFSSLKGLDITSIVSWWLCGMWEKREEEAKQINQRKR